MYSYMYMHLIDTAQLIARMLKTYLALCIVSVQRNCYRLFNIIDLAGSGAS